MNRLTISVIIPNYNYGRFLAEAIESVLSQTYPCKEIIVVDDGSTDNSLEILKGYQGRIKAITQKNCGVGMARNTGVKNSSGDIVAFLDADDYWFAEKIEKQIKYFRNDEEVGLVTCGLQEFDNRGIIRNHENNLSGWVSARILSFSNSIIVSGSAIVVKRDVFESVDGFDERKELHPSEDWEFCYRVANISKIAFVPEMLVHYRNHGDNGHLKIPRMEHAMHLAYKKIYATAPPEIQKLKRESYGNLYSVLAGSYFHTGNYFKVVKSVTRSLWYKPGKIIGYLAFPFRRLRRYRKIASVAIKE